MKKIIITMVLGLLALNLSFAGQADLFSYDSDALDNKLQPLEELETYVAANPEITLTDLRAQDNVLVNDLNLANHSGGMATSFSGEPALGIPGFWWGCILGPVGVLVVHLVAEDSSETRSAVWGCLASVGASVLLSGAYYGCIWLSYGGFWY